MSDRQPQQDLIAADAKPGADPGARALADALAVVMKVMVVLLVVLLAVSLSRCFVVVKKHEVGRVYRFGRLRRELAAGQFALIFPPPIDEYRAYTVSRERVIESKAFMYAAPRAPEQQPEPTLRTGVEGYGLTGDQNIVHCDVTVSYRVIDPVVFHEMQADGEKTLAGCIDNAVLRTLAGIDADTALFSPARTTEQATTMLRERIAALELGVEVTRVVIYPRTPRQVKEAFDAQLVARNEADRRRREAEAYRQQVSARAESSRASVLARARVEGDTRAQLASAWMTAFGKLAVQYTAEGGKTMREEMRLDAVQRVLTHAEEVFVVDERDGRQVRVQLSRQGRRSEDAGASKEGGR